MIIVIGVMAIANIILGLVSAVPCLMVAAMSGDNPKYVNTMLHVFVVWAFLLFPVICLLAGVVSPILWCCEYKNSAVALSVVPLLEAGIVISFLALYSYITGN